MTTLIEQTKEAVERMSRLLDDPHPGLATWNIALLRAFDELAKLFSAEKPESQEGEPSGEPSRYGVLWTREEHYEFFSSISDLAKYMASSHRDLKKHDIVDLFASRDLDKRENEALREALRLEREREAAREPLRREVEELTKKHAAALSAYASESTSLSAFMEDMSLEGLERRRDKLVGMVKAAENLKEQITAMK